MAAPTLIVGAEEFLLSRAVTAAIDARRGAADSVGVDVADVAASECDPFQLQELTSPSLFGDDRILVLSAVQEADKALLSAVVDLIGARQADRLIMTHAGGAKGKSVLEALKSAGVDLVTVEAPRAGRDREQWVADEVARHSGTIDRDAVAELVVALSSDLRELATVVAQLVADAGPHLTRETVLTYHRGRSELTGFVVADRAVEGQVAAAIEAARWALATGVEPVLISSSLAANLRLIGLVAGAERRSPEALAGQLKQPPWKIRRAQGWLRRWRPEALVEAMAAVAAADAEVKGAGDDAAYAVERAVLAVASVCAA
jgi:DNA polymerase-3 subunit delta